MHDLNRESGKGAVRGRPALCVVSPSQSGGGAEYQIGCLLEVLARRRHFELHYLARHLDSSVPHSHYQVTKVGRSNGAPRWGYVADALPLFAALRAIGPGVIYQRVACGYTGLCSLYATRHDSRMVWHISSESDIRPERDRSDRNPLRRSMEKCSVEYGLRHAHAVVAQTQEQSAMMQQAYGRAADAIVPNFHPPAGEPVDKSGPLTVMWVANVKPLKRPEAFVRLAAALRDRGDVRFVMAGAAPGDWAGAWGTSLSTLMKSVPNLTFLGLRPQAEVNSLLARAHLLVNTSTREGFPNTFIQAWMRGVPVISLDVDPDGVLAREEIGVLARSEPQLETLVRAFLSDTVLREAYGRRALAYASKAHSLRNAELLADLLERVAELPGGLPMHRRETRA